MVEANGVECKILFTAPTMTICDCNSLQPNTSYNITADSNSHTDSITCNTTMEQCMCKNSASVITRSEIYCFRTIILYISFHNYVLYNLLVSGQSVATASASDHTLIASMEWNNPFMLLHYSLLNAQCLVCVLLIVCLQLSVGTCSASGALFVIVLVLLIVTVTIVQCKRMRPPPDKPDKGNMNEPKKVQSTKIANLHAWL